MSMLTLQATARESLALSEQSDPVIYLVMFGLILILIWAVKVAGTALVSLFRAAVAAATTALAVTVIPLILLGLLFLSVI